MKETLEEKLRTYLEEMPLPTLRTLGREVGVSRPASSRREDLINQVIRILTGEVPPAPRPTRGAPVKKGYLSPVVMENLMQIKREFAMEGDMSSFVVASPDSTHPIPDAPFDPVYKGILEITPGGYGFLRAKNCQPSPNGEDVYLSSQAIRELRLRRGDLVTCTAKPRQKNESPALDILGSVNGIAAGSVGQRPAFDSLTAVYPSEKICLSAADDDLSLRVLDMFVPIGKGQRGLIIAPPKAGKTTLLKSIARSINKNHKDLELIVLLIDERPEEVSDFRTTVPGATVIYSTFDESAERHARAAELTIEHAKRLAEIGKHVVVLLDSLTKLTRAHNLLAEATGKTLSGGLEAAALTSPKQFFGAARNTVEGGSITILATVLVETGSRMDDVIYEEFKGTGNADIFLSRELAERRVFPAIDIRRSGTRKEEFLLREEELAAVYKMRERGLTDNVPGFLDMLKRTGSNEEFISRLSEWIRIYKS